MQTHRESSPAGRVTPPVRWLLLVALVTAVSTLPPRRAEAQLPAAAQVVAAVAQWMSRWLGEYLLGRGADVAMERVRGRQYREQLEQVERTIRRQMSSRGSSRSQLQRELRLVQRQLRLIDGVMNPAFSRDSARIYYGRVNQDWDELRQVVQAVAGSMDDMQRELDDLRREVSALRGQRHSGDDDDSGWDDEETESSRPDIPKGVRLGLGYVAGLSRFTVPAYSNVGESALHRRQQGATVHVGTGNILRLGVTASVLGAWLDSSARGEPTSDPANRQPLQTVTLASDLSLALAPRSSLTPLIGIAAEQVWMSFRSLPGVSEPDVVFSGIVYGPQVGLDLKLIDGFSVTFLARSMSGKLHVPVDQLQGLRDTRGLVPHRRQQLMAYLSYKEGR